MKTAKLFLIGLLQVTLLFAFVACESDPDTEGSFLTPGGVDPDLNGNPSWDWVDAYPGPVSILINPEIDAVAKVRGGYDPIVYSEETPILQSTGLWARSAEVITVDVPADVEGLHWQIGMGQPLYDITIQKGQRRYRDVTTKGELTAGESNQITNNFGGFIYFYYEPEDMPDSPDYREVIVNGAVAALSYVDGETDNGDYTRTMLELSEKLLLDTSTDADLAFVPWTELISDKVILTLGVKEMSVVTNPKALLEVYGKIHDAYLEFAGYDPNDPRQAPMRVVSDIQLPNPLQTNVGNNNEDLRKIGGYPMVSLRHKEMRNRNGWLDERNAVNYNRILEFSDPNSVFMHIHDSFGKTVFGDPNTSWAYVTNLHYPLLRLAALYYARTKLDGDIWLPTKYMAPGFNKAIVTNTITPDIANKPLKYIHGQYAYAMYSGYSDQVNDLNAANAYGRIQNGGMDNTSVLSMEGTMTTMFVQLIEKYGWDLIPYIFNRARELNFSNEYQQDAFDFIVMACCEFTNSDLRPFFKWWRLSYTKWASDFASQFPTIPGAFNDINNLYWFITLEFPEFPVLDLTKGQVPVKINSWPEKMYYQTILPTFNTRDNDSTNNAGWWVSIDKTDMFPAHFDPNAVIPWTLNAKENENQRIVRENYDWQLQIYDVLQTKTASELTWRSPWIVIHFLNNNQPELREFNAIEISTGMKYNQWTLATHDWEIFVPDDPNNLNPNPNAGGQWVPISPNRPLETSNWYDGVIWPIPHIVTSNTKQDNYAYYFEDTYKATKIRFKAVPGKNDGLNTVNTGTSAGNDNGWHICLRKIKLAMVSADNPAPPSPDSPEFVPLWQYQKALIEVNAWKDKWQEYDTYFGTDPAPPGFRGWLNAGRRDYNM